MSAMPEGTGLPDTSGRRSPALTIVQKLLVVLLIGVPLGRLLLPLSPHLLSPVDKHVLWVTVGTGFIMAQTIFWGSFAAGTRRPGHAAAKITLGALSVFFGALYALLFSFFAGPIFGLYELRYLPHGQRNMFYVIELVSATGRGGPHAYVDPYGFGQWGLPLSKADYDAFRGGRYTSRALVCYRVIELRRDDVVGMVEPSEYGVPSNALTRCAKGGRRVVMFDTDYRANRS